MKSLSLQTYLSIPVLAMLTSCASGEHRAGTAQGNSNPVAQIVAQDSEVQDFVEIEFGLGSAALSDAAKTSLIDVVSKAKLAGKVDEVIVLSWSDLEYPARNSATQPRDQRNLAGERNRAIKSYLQSARSGVDVDTYNMAEKPNTLSKWFDTSDNQLKRAFVKAGLPTTQDSPQYEGKASRAVILVKIE